MGEFSISHVLILTLVLLIFFGPSRLPALGQSIGKAIRGFKDGMNDVHTEMNKPIADEPVDKNAQIPSPPDVVNQKKEDKSNQNNS